MKRRNFLKGLFASAVAIATMPVSVAAEKAIVKLVGISPSPTDPLGQRGYVGTKIWSTQWIQNEAWVAIIEDQREVKG